MNFFKRCYKLCKIQVRHISSNRGAPGLNNLLLTMPKEMTHTVALKKQRIKIKEKNSRYAPGIVSLQVVGTGAKGASRSLYLFTDQSRYLFNCGEGTQRLAHEHKVKLAKLEHIFLTHASWKNLGGLPGVALTLQDVGVPNIILHGPEGVDEIFDATRKFIILKNLSLRMAHCSPEHIYEDNAIKVKYIPLYLDIKSSKSQSELKDESEVSEDETDYYEYERKGRKSTSHVQPKKAKRPRLFSGLDKSRMVMCYSVRLQPKPGTLCLEKCVEKGVPPGPLLGRLKNGEDIFLEDGTLVKSSDVTLPNDPGPLFLVVECPSEEFLPLFESEDAFKKHQLETDKEEDIAFTIVHFTPYHILTNERYKKWMSKFPLTTYHLLLNDDNTCMGSTAVHRIQEKLNLLEPQIFPRLGDTGISRINSDDEKSTNNTFIPSEGSQANGSLNDFNVINAHTLCNISLRPKKLFNNSNKLVIEPDIYLQEVNSVEGFSEELMALKEKLSQINVPVQEFPQIVFLGTGSCIPNKTRNTSGILLKVDNSTNILLDCGEGTYGQLVRFYGRQRVDEEMKKIKAVYISHLHADHHIGLFGLIKARQKVVEKDAPLILLAPKQISSWLNLYDRHFEPILQGVQLLPNSSLVFNNYKISDENEQRLQDILGFSSVRTANVIHCPNSFGVAFRHRQGWKISYSGDTMPSDDFIKIGQSSDLLIHEATMEDELESEARIKLHSTTSQAIKVGNKMNAKFIMLTHFSQRYSKVPRLTGTSLNNVGIAFDNMQVRFSDFPKLQLLYPSLMLMFQEECEEMEQKALKRQFKSERLANKMTSNAAS